MNYEETYKRVVEIDEDIKELQKLISYFDEYMFISLSLVYQPSYKKGSWSYEMKEISKYYKGWYEEDPDKMREISKYYKSRYESCEPQNSNELKTREIEGRLESERNRKCPNLYVPPDIFKEIATKHLKEKIEKLKKERENIIKPKWYNVCFWNSQ